MKQFISGIGAAAISILFLSGTAFAQTTTDPTSETPSEPEVVGPVWKPGDGRPVWSRSPNPTTAPEIDWRPGDGRPPWANAHGLNKPTGTEGPSLILGRAPGDARPAWAGRPADASLLRGQRRIDAQALGRGPGARGIGNRGRGRP